MDDSSSIADEPLSLSILSSIAEEPLELSLSIDDREFEGKVSGMEVEDVRFEPLLTSTPVKRRRKADDEHNVYQNVSLSSSSRAEELFWVEAAEDSDSSHGESFVDDVDFVYCAERAIDPSEECSSSSKIKAAIVKMS